MSPDANDWGPPFTVDAVAGDVVAALGEGSNAVLVAEPGAGKTTRLPLYLLQAPWLEGQKIVMLEPRRLAARAAARRLAASLGEEVGATVGYAVRFERRIGTATRLEVVTEGVLARRIRSDPELAGTGLLIFDEFHERSLDADMSLALALDVQGALRPDLRLLVMSATLDTAPLAALLGDAPVISVKGRTYPVSVRHLPPSGRGRLEDEVVAGVKTALAETAQGLLVFLPGEAEIRRAAERLAAAQLGPSTDIVPLYGALSGEEQDRAIRSSPQGRRKVVLATTIAETSLTIEGIGAVIDSGLKRVPRFDPRSGMARLETVPVSLTAATQRAGRAGRLGPGVAYRLWDERKTRTLPERDTPEILETDLSPLLLDLAGWGVSEPTQLKWLDPPPGGALAQARDLLLTLGAIDAAGSLTPLGRRMAGLPLHPRLAHMVVEGDRLGMGWRACVLAAVLAERDMLRGRTGIDLAERLGLALGGKAEAPNLDRGALTRVRAAARQIAGIAGIKASDQGGDAGLLVGLAYPDRIALRRGAGGRFLMASGGGAVVDAADPLAAEKFLAIALTDGKPGDARVYLAARLDEAVIETRFGDAILATEEITWDDRASVVKARRTRRLGALLIAEGSLPEPDPQAVAAVLLKALAAAGADALPWTPAARTLQQRLAFVAREGPEEDWPDCRGDALMARLDEWLRPHVGGLTRLADLGRLDLASLLKAELTWTQRQRLDDLAPERYVIPSGAAMRLDYGSGEVPVLAARLQELFSLDETPRIAGGRVAVKVALLSPAGRPLAITRDLAGFWRGGYAQVRAETRGRYPKHAWPEDPLTAKPVAPNRTR